MRIVAITRLLDEADIIEAFVRHTAHYASSHFFIDNGSRDGTLAILEQLRTEGFDLLVFQNKSVSFNEVEFNTRLFNEAVERRAADWVLCLDADEFIDDRDVEGGLGHVLACMRTTDPETLCLRVPLMEYRVSPQDDARELVIPKRIDKRLQSFDIDKVFLSGSFAGPDFAVGPGNHGASRAGHDIAARRVPGLKLAHYAERSAHQVMVKWIRGWSKVLAAGSEKVAEGANIHYKDPFEILRDDPQRLLRNPAFLQLQGDRPLVADPIVYRGDGLRYTGPLDEPLRAARMLMGYMEDLATRHGRLIDTCPDAERLVRAWDEDLTILMG